MHQVPIQENVRESFLNVSRQVSDSLGLEGGVLEKVLTSPLKTGANIMLFHKFFFILLFMSSVKLFAFFWRGPSSLPPNILVHFFNVYTGAIFSIILELTIIKLSTTRGGF